mgnify:CR=1 FL=1
MTHINNLASVMKYNILYSANQYPSNDPFTPIHNEDVQDKRKKTIVPVAPGQVLWDYVPFYFGTHTPMLYYNYINHHNQDDIIYFVTTAQNVAHRGYQYAFTDGHAIQRITAWYNDLKDLSKLDWESIYRRYWGPRQDSSGEYKRKKQSEFLVYRHLSWDVIRIIGVRTVETQKLVAGIMADFPAERQRRIVVKPVWYF